MKHIVCFSGGEGSALTSLEVAKKYGAENLILINHDITPRSELADVKRFKKDVADYLGVPITYANHKNWETMDQFDVCVQAKSFVNPKNRTILCTHRLKTEPFYRWLEDNYNKSDVIYYGFDSSEPSRITRRSTILGKDNYLSDYPLALWKERTFFSTKDVGIAPPMQYDTFKHANCIGCLKAGWQHWYVIFCQYPETWEKAKRTEEIIGYSVHNDYFFEEKESMFEFMKSIGIPATEKIPSGKFWATVRREMKKSVMGSINLFDMPVEEKQVECITDCGIDRDF